MASYEDTVKINSLYQEQQQIKHAIDMLDQGGSVPSFVVSPPTQTNPDGMPAPSAMMSVAISTVQPSEILLQEVYELLIEQHNKLSAELEALGVTDTPVETTRSYKSKSKDSESEK